MHFKIFVVLAALTPVFARYRIIERNGRAIFPRRFGQENDESLNLIRDAGCSTGDCATFAGQAISTLLAGAPECAQQDLADKIIDFAKGQDDAKLEQNLIDAAIALRTAEKNTPPDFSTNPPTLRNSVFCQKAPKNAELNGLVQAQDPANDPNIFFDPATKASVEKGAQANTEPFADKKRAVKRAFKFSGNLGAAIPAVTDDGNGKFSVEGNATFNSLQSALIRACDVQNNKCANATNGSGGKAGFSVSDCNAQQAQCIAQSKASVAK